MRIVVEGTVVLESRSMHPDCPIETVVILVEGELNDCAEAVAEKYKVAVKKLREEDK